MTIRGIFYSLFLILLVCEAKASVPSLEELSKHSQWLTLLHYNETLFGGYESEADSQNFFLHPRGKTKPYLEIQSTLQNFQRDLKKPTSNKSSFCQFPARYRFLSQKRKSLPLKALKDCHEYQSFQKKIDSEGLALVFSSYYLNTPASAFGHTFLRFIKQPEGKNRRKYQLLDYAANYAATVTTSNSLIYAYQGMTGGFEGEFSFLPYFYKVREYNDFESRDLWSYELNLTEEQRNLVAAHLWEMKQTTFDYYYFTENCSYHMLTLLDVANPEWKLAKRNPYFVVPVDTLRTVEQTPGLVKDITFRPSKRRAAVTRVSHLTETEDELFSRLIQGPETEVKKLIGQSNLSTQEKARVIDAAMDYVDFQYAEEILMKESEWDDYKRNLLVNRAKLGIPSKPLKIKKPKNQEPHTGHKTKRFAVGMGRGDQSEEFLRLDYRFTLHDFFDADQGHNPNASIEMGNLQLRVYNDYQKGDSKRLSLEEFSLFRVTSLSPYQEYFSTWSWKIDVGYKTFRTLKKAQNCELCHGPYGLFGGGTSIEWGDILFSALLVGETQISKDLSRRGFLAGLGPEAMLLWNPLKGLKIGVTADYKKFWPNGPGLEDPRLEINPKIRQTFKNWALGLEGDFTPYEDQVQLVYYLYL